MFLGGINFKQFLSSYKEWHAFSQGFCEVLCPWPPRHKTMKASLTKEITDEHHYYMFGRAVGVGAWLIIVIIIKAIF